MAQLLAPLRRGAATGPMILRDALILWVLLVVIAVALSIGPAGSVVGQLPYLDELVLRLVHDGAGAATPFGENSLADLRLQRLGILSSAALSVMVVSATMLALYGARPGPTTIWVVILAIAACLLLVIAGLTLSARWWPPAGTILALALAGPLWSWRRFVHATAALLDAARELRVGPDLLPSAIDTIPMEALARELAPLHDAATRIHLLRGLLEALIDEQPRPVIVSNGAGEVLLSNRVARTSFASMPIEEQSITAWLRIEFNEHPLLNRLPRPEEPDRHGIEAVDRNARSWQVSIERIQEASQPLAYLLRFTPTGPAPASSSPAVQQT